MVNDDQDRRRAGLLWTVILAACLVLIAALTAQPAPSQALGPLDVSVAKAVDHYSVEPGQAPAPLYTVTFTNSSTATLVLDAITDTLPAGFMFSGMHWTSEWQESPVDPVAPDIVWQGPITVPATGTLSLVYAVYVPSNVPPSTVPYTNTVVADMDGQLIGPASAGLYVGASELTLAKTAAPTRVLNGDPVLYSVTVANVGQLSGDVAVITDTLDPSLTFAGMAAGSDLGEPEIDGSTLSWTGPFTIPAGDDLVARYTVTAPGGSNWSWPCNRAEVLVNGESLNPAETCIEVGPEKATSVLPFMFKNLKNANFTIGKSVSPTSLMAIPGAAVTYDVTIVNVGDRTGVVGSVYDVLPAGFTFLQMMPESDVQANPSGTTGTITWSGPWTILGQGQLRLVYQATINQTPGQYMNSANLTTWLGAPPAAPASAWVTVEPGILLEEHFENGTDAWTEYLHYWRLKPEQWYWSPVAGVNGTGAANHECCEVGEAEDALMMYLGEGAEQWTDYRVEAKFNFHYGSGPVGLWVRGQHEDSDRAGQWVTGYYISTGGRPTDDKHFVKIGQLQTLTDCWGNACNNPQNLYHFSNPHDLIQVSVPGPLTRETWHTLAVEVRGARIIVWMDGQQVIDFTDPKEPFLTGAVGFKVYKANWISYDDVIVTPIQ